MMENGWVVNGPYCNCPDQQMWPEFVTEADRMECPQHSLLDAVAIAMQGFDAWQAMEARA